MVSKRMKALYAKNLEQKKFTSLEEVVEEIQSNSTAKFNESIDIVVKLGINPRKSEENVRGTFILSHGVSKKVKIAAFVSDSMKEEVMAAGADIVGLSDLVDDIKQDGKINFDICFTTIEFLPKIVPIAKLLGQSGVMPNKKDGTVTVDILKAIKDAKEGRKCNFKNDSAGYLQLSIGKVQMDKQKITQNINEFVSYIKGLKPPKVKEMILNVSISSTMGIGLKIPIRLFK